jgi:hypothetical protein
MKLQIEGVDGIGKTTLTENLRKALKESGVPTDIFRFARFPGQDAMEDLQRWAWMDYVHLHVAKALFLSEPKQGLIFDRGPASNFVLRSLRLLGFKEILSLDDAALFQFADNLYRSESFTQLREAERLLAGAGVRTLLLQPVLCSDWLALRNLYRNEPDYAHIPDSIQAVVRLYNVWASITPLFVTTLYLEEGESTSNVAARAFEEIRIHAID